MRRPHVDIGRTSVLAIAVAGAMAGGPRTGRTDPPTTRFDGNWTVTLACNRTIDGGLPYSYRFPAEVKGGAIHGEHGVAGQPAYLVIDGRIGADGEATMLADGLTNAPNYTLGRVPPGQPYTYRIKAHFGDTHGSGTRLSGGGRSCTLDFVKR